MNPSIKITRARLLSQLYREFDFKSRVYEDPIEFLYPYQKPAELELVAFLCSSLAFGKIELFKPIIRKILEMGNGDLVQFVLNFNPARDKKLFKQIYYRIWTEKDLACLIYALKIILTEHGSLENLFLKNNHPEDEHLEQAMIKFSEEFLDFNPAEIYGINQFTRSFKYFVPSPRSGSACKRFCLFLRWMIRKEDVDLGIWKTIEPAKLIIPLDTHIFKMARFLKLTRKKTIGWKMAKEITSHLRKIEPNDPLKFDFPLCHFSIRGACAGNGIDLCLLCTARKKCYFEKSDFN